MLVGRGVQATEVGDHQGTPSFAFSDPEGRWFAVTQASPIATGLEAGRRSVAS